MGGECGISSVRGRRAGEKGDMRGKKGMVKNNEDLGRLEELKEEENEKEKGMLVAAYDDGTWRYSTGDWSRVWLVCSHM